MKPILLFLLCIVLLGNIAAQQLQKKELLYKGLQNKANHWELVFEDKKKKPWYFNVQHSNTAPYIFYTTDVDGSLKENEKIKGSWFWISYTVLEVGKVAEKMIVRAEAVKNK
ncbi:MAG: hypothetical protein KA319_14290 [Ferruginibacter sp.]|nr:hypothetical protein [Ferruginibacter sp.]